MALPRKRRQRVAAVLVAGAATAYFAGPTLAHEAQQRIDAFDAASTARWHATTDPIANKAALAQCSAWPWDAMSTADITHRAGGAGGDPTGQVLATANGGIWNDDDD